MTQFECQAILFDLDGTLVDSTASVERCWRQWSARAGLDFESVMAVAHGRPAAETLQQVAPHLDLAIESAWLEDAEATDAHTVAVIDGAHELLRSMPMDRWCIVTSGTDRLARARIHHAGLPLPHLLITADDITHGKPHPEPYLVGARKMGLSPVDCVVIEDSTAGVESAKAAGMRVIAVAETHDSGTLKTADLIVPRLRDLRITRFTNESGVMIIDV